MNDTLDTLATGTKPSRSWRGALDLWGVTRTRALTYVALAITAAFVVLEIAYNLDLLDAIIDPTSTREQVQGLSERGKLLTSLGLAWVVGRFLLERLRPALLGVLMLAAVAGVTYTALDHLYTTVIRDLPPQVKLQAFRLFSYRQDLLAGRLSDPDITLPKDDPVRGRVLMGAFPIVLLDQRFMLPASDVIERKANDSVRFALKDAEAGWADYDRKMSELRKGHQDFVAGSRQAVQNRAFGGIEQFRKRSGGLEPAPNMSISEFVEMLRRSQHPQGKALREAEANQVGRRQDGSPILAGDLPRFMSRQQYLDWFSAEAKAARDRLMPTIGNIHGMAGIDDINAAVFLPPMAMIASLASALTNALTFVLISCGLLLTLAPQAVAKRVGDRLRRFATPLMLAAFLAILLVVPGHVFPPGPLRGLEDRMHRELGMPGQVWSRISNVQVLVLSLSGAGGRR